jgi:hypothetical protein
MNDVTVKTIDSDQYIRFSANMVYSRAECVFILAQKSFAVVRKAFSNAYPDRYRLRHQYTDW